MKYNLHIRRKLNIFIMFVLLAYSLSQMSWHELVSGRVCWALLFFGCVFFVIQMLLKKHKSISLYLILNTAMILVVFLFNNQNLKNGENGYEIAFLCTVLFSMAMYNKKYWINYAIGTMLVLGIIYAMVTLISFGSQGIYEAVFRPFVIALNKDTEHMGLSAYYSDGLTTHYSFNGIYVAMAVCTSIGLLIPIKGKKVELKWLKICFVGLMLLALLLTNKRAHILFTAIGALIAYFVYNSNKPTKRITKMLLVILGIVVGGYILYSLLPETFAFLNRFEQYADSNDVSNGRYELWQIALVFSKGNYLTGAGWWSFMHHYGSHVHNVYVQLFVETGIIGTIVFVTYFISSYVKTIMLLNDNRKKVFYLGDQADRHLVISLIYQTFFVLYGITGTCLYEFSTFIPYFLFCAITEYYWYTRRRIIKQRERNKL